MMNYSNNKEVSNKNSNVNNNGNIKDIYNDTTAQK